MKTIAFDTLGNDKGALDGLLAVKEFIAKNKDFKFMLVGDADEIVKVFPEQSANIEIIDCKNEVKGELGARAARGEDNSMSVAINLVKDQKADVVISAGNSGAYLSLSTLILKRISGIKRPAFMPVFPTIFKGKKFVLLDAGANLEVDAEMLKQWAMLGSAFVENVLGVKNPKVGIVNIGTEDEKGHVWAKEANLELKNSKDLNYQGFVETRDLLRGETDVAVVDGYGGNLVLKTMEGTALAMLSLIKQSLSAKLKYKIGALIAKGGFVAVKETLDYRNVGAAWILGLNGLAAKAHGSSDKKAYLGAFNQIKEALEKNVLEEFKKAVVANE